MRVPGSRGATVYNPIFLHFKMKRIKSPILLMISVRVMQRVESRLNSVLFYCWDSLVTLGCSKVRRGGYSGSIARGMFSQSGVRSTGVDVWLSALMFWIYMRLNKKKLLKEKTFPQQQCDALNLSNIFIYFAHVLSGCCLYRLSNHQNYLIPSTIRTNHLHEYAMHSKWVQH